MVMIFLSDTYRLPLSVDSTGFLKHSGIFFLQYGYKSHTCINLPPLKKFKTYRITSWEKTFVRGNFHFAISKNITFILKICCLKGKNLCFLLSYTFKPIG